MYTKHNNQKALDNPSNAISINHTRIATTQLVLIAGLLSFIVSMFLCEVSFGQGVGINNPTPAASAILDVTSTTKGLLIPRMTGFQRAAISAPATGLIVYDTSFNQFYYFDGTVWRPLATNNTAWNLSGNSGTSSTTNFLGTIDNNDLVVRTNNTEKMRVTSTGNVGIGTVTPSSKLHIEADGATGPIERIHSTTDNPCTMNFSTASKSFKVGQNRPPDSPTSTNGFYIYDESAATTRVYVAGNGQVGIGTVSPSQKLSVSKGMNVDNDNTNNGTLTNALLFGAAGTNEGIASKRTAGGNQEGLDFYTNSANRMCITNDGVVGIGTTSPTATRLQVYDPSTATARVAIFKNNSALGTEVQVGSIEYLHDYSSTTDFNNGANSVGLSINLAASTSYDLQLATNSAAKPGGGSWTAPSDMRLKEDVHTFKEGLEVLRKIKPVYYKYNGKAKTPQDYFIGVIAQEIKEVAPYTVGTYEFLPDENDIKTVEQYYNYNPDALHYITLNAVKELDDKQNKAREVFVNISDFGNTNLSGEVTRINFSEDFGGNMNEKVKPVVVMTTVNSTAGITIVSQDAKGFVVKVNSGQYPVEINWTAMAKVNETILDANKAYTENERQDLLSKVKLPDLSIRKRHIVEMDAMKNQH